MRLEGLRIKFFPYATNEPDLQPWSGSVARKYSSPVLLPSIDSPQCRKRKGASIMNTSIRVALVSLLGLAVQASAANRVCIGGDLDHMTEAQRQGCLASAAQVREAAGRFHAPADWHFYVMCTEEDWQAYTAFSKRSAAEVSRMSGDTDFDRHTTFLRGGRLATSSAVAFDKIVAREVASATLRTADEAAIQEKVAAWMSDSDRGTLTLQGSR